MIELILEARKCEETGGVGIALLGHNDSHDGDLTVMFDGRGVAHDVLEHVNGPEAIGTVADEFEALGAVWWIRGSVFDLSRDGTGIYFTPAQNLASDLVRMFRYYSEEYINIPEQPPCDYDEDFAEILQHAREDAPAEYEDEDFNRADFEHYLWQALQGMRLGYRKALARSLDGDKLRVNGLFWAIAEACERTARSPDEGQQYLLRYDPSGLRGADLSEYWEDEPLICSNCDEEGGTLYRYSAVEDWCSDCIAAAMVREYDRAEIIEELEFRGTACFDDESTGLLREALHDSLVGEISDGDHYPEAYA